MSLDGFIADPHGGYDWIVIDPEIDFEAMFKPYDTVLMGRKSYDAAVKQGGYGMPGKKTYVFSRTLRQRECPDATVSDDLEKTVRALKRKKTGKDTGFRGRGTVPEHARSRAGGRHRGGRDPGAPGRRVADAPQSRHPGQAQAREAPALPKDRNPAAHLRRKAMNAATAQRLEPRWTPLHGVRQAAEVAGSIAKTQKGSVPMTSPVMA
jgi:hypothetical protein